MAQILVVEDNVILRFVLAEWLRSDGYDVLEAVSADEAVTILSSVAVVDLVVTDIQMPGSMDGLDLADYILKTTPALPVVVVSGNRFVDRLQTVAVAAFFPKPYDVERLSNYIATLVPPTEAISKECGQAGNER